MHGQKETVRLAIAGCGQLSVGIHLPSIVDIEGVRVTAIADSDPEALRRAARIVPDARSMADWSDLIEGDDVDAVLITLPTHLHAAAATAVLRAGKHLYLEKPVAASLDGARQLRAAARDSKAVAMVGFNYRFNHLFDKLGATLRAGTIGPLVAVRSCFSTYGQAGGWRADPSTGGGVLLDLASHHADLIPHLTGRHVTAVSATVVSRIVEGDTAVVTFEMEGDVVAQSLFTAAGPEQDTIELIGQTGSAIVRRYESVAVEVRGRNAAGARRDQLANLVRTVRGVPYLRAKRAAPGNEPSYEIALRRFIDCVRTGAAAMPGIDEGIASLAIIESARRAATEGRKVRVERDPAASTPDAASSTGP